MARDYEPKSGDIVETIEEMPHGGDLEQKLHLLAAQLGPTVLGVLMGSPGYETNPLIIKEVDALRRLLTEEEWNMLGRDPLDV